MISRLSAFAALFAVLTTATLAFAASASQDDAAASASAPAVRVVQLPTVVIVGHRDAAAPI